MSPSRLPPLDARKIVYLAVFLVIVLHGGLLPFTVGQTYDAYIHMFFGDHYHRSWFDPWEPRWYTGFTVTAYPPGSHQLIGALLFLMPHTAAFIVVQIFAVSVLAIGVYRFSRLWVDDLPAAFAALICVSSTSIAETLHIFGQLPTTLSIGIFLNATPHIYHWIRDGRARHIPLAMVFTAGATAAHHVTPIFATLLFVAPLGIHAWINALAKADAQTGRAAPLHWTKLLAAPLRGVGLGLGMLIIIILVVYPYWHWSITDPINQVSIPHGSRENFLQRPDLGLIFFIIPWGLVILVVPYVIWSVFRSRLWPLALSVLLCLGLGTGGTTPLPERLLGPAFHILTLDRFTFWATILIMPFAGTIAASLLLGKGRKALTAAFGRPASRILLAGLATLYGTSGVLVAVLPLAKPTQPDFIDPTPIVQFMAEDSHNDWRYLTLGFGDQFAYHSALIDGYSVDGNYHSARRLPQLTSYSVERLENSKYLGVPGLGSLQQFVANAETYQLKFIFSNDEFYDPLLYYSGWNRLLRLRNGVVVWEKPGISPITQPVPRRSVPKYQAYAWATIPPASLFLVFVALVRLAAGGKLVEIRMTEFKRRDQAVTRQDIQRIRAVAICLAGVSVALCLTLTLRTKPETMPQALIAQYYMSLDRREFADAHDLLLPTSRPDYETFLKTLRSRGGLIFSYSKLLDLKTQILTSDANTARLQVDRTYLTAVGTRTVSDQKTVVRTQYGWRLDSEITPKTLTDATAIMAADISSHDVSATRDASRGTHAIGLDRPTLHVAPPRILNFGNRIRVLGSVTNTSSRPACLTGAANAYFDSSSPVQQYMGSLGAHRLLPGQTRHYSIEFEGVLTLQDADGTKGFDPEFFRLPEFQSSPQSVDVDFKSLFCHFDHATGLKLSDIAVSKDGRELSVSVSNTGTQVAGVVKISLIYFDTDGQIALVQPHYIETNLIPGEIRQERVQLASLELKPVSERPRQTEAAEHASRAPDENRTGEIALHYNSGFTSMSIEIDAMPFDPEF